MALSAAGAWPGSTRYMVGAATLVVGVPLLLAWQDGLLKARRGRRA